MPIIQTQKLENGICFALWEITETHDELQAILPSEILTDAELATIPHPQKQKEFFASRLTIKYLANFLNIVFLGIKKDENGKPFLVGSDWHFSLSHTQKYIAVAMHPTKEIGIDLEKPTEKLLRIQRKVFNENEIKDAENDLEKLCVYWGAKEAIYKAFGKKKVSFKDNISIKSLKKEEIKGKLKTDEIEKSYQLSVYLINEYYLITAI